MLGQQDLCPLSQRRQVSLGPLAERGLQHVAVVPVRDRVRAQQVLVHRPPGWRHLEVGTVARIGHVRVVLGHRAGGERCCGGDQRPGQAVEPSPAQLQLPPSLAPSERPGPG
jgi:hypothetical protein